ncbi:MAG TPA: hypothetical protein VHZ03_35975 [Trebonia sp.]|nr:hypothetical protein [Trebonia sp.]
MAAFGAETLILHELSSAQLQDADARYPKWATICRLRLLGLPVLNAALIIPGEGESRIAAVIEALAKSTGSEQLMLRSDGGIERRRYYQGGNSFSLEELKVRVAPLLDQGRAVILLEPTNRFTNRMTALLRMERSMAGGRGSFTIEALGPGYDVADLTRGGVRPQVTVTATDIDWACYRPLWWSDLRLSQDRAPAAEQERRRQHLERIGSHVLSDTYALDPGLLSADPAGAAEAWLRKSGYLELWDDQEITDMITQRARDWFECAFLITKFHRNKAWTCLAAAVSNLGAGRWVFWDVVDGNYKYGSTRGRLT